MNKRQRKKLLKERIVAVACGQWKPIIGKEETNEDGSVSIKGILIPKRRKEFDSWCKHMRYEELGL